MLNFGLVFVGLWCLSLVESVLDCALLDSDDFPLVVRHLGRLEYGGGGEILELGSFAVDSMSAQAVGLVSSFRASGLNLWFGATAGDGP